MTEVSFDKSGFLNSLSINPDTLVKVTIKANQKLKFNSELNTLTNSIAPYGSDNTLNLIVRYDEVRKLVAPREEV